MSEYLTLGLETWPLIFGVSGIIGGGFLRGFLGFGSALLIVPVISIILTPVEAIVIFFLIELPNVVYLMPPALREFDFRNISLMILAIIFTVPVGVFALVTIDPTLMKITISAIVLMMVFLLASGWKYKGKISPFFILLTGAVGGIAHGATGIGGPPLITILLSRGDDARRTRANIVMALNTLSIIGAITLLFFGAITFQLFLASCVLSPLYIGFTALGSYYFNSSGNEIFRKAALFVLALIAGLILYSNF